MGPFGEGADTTDMQVLTPESVTFWSGTGTVTESHRGNPLGPGGEEMKLRVIKCGKCLNRESGRISLDRVKCST